MFKKLINLIFIMAIAVMVFGCSRKSADAPESTAENASPQEVVTPDSGVCKMRQGNTDDKIQYLLSRINQIDDKLNGNDAASLDNELASYDKYLSDKSQKFGAVKSHLDSLRIKIINFETKSCAGFSVDDYYSPKDADIYRVKLVELGRTKEWDEWNNSLGALKDYTAWEKAVNKLIAEKSKN